MRFLPAREDPIPIRRGSTEETGGLDMICSAWRAWPEVGMNRDAYVSDGRHDVSRHTRDPRG